MVPKAVAVLLGFTPEGAYNLQDGSQYLNFVLKFIVAFGCAFLLPVFLVALNLVGVLPARAMLKGWRPAVMIIFVFAAIMTPTPDAYTMLFLASPDGAALLRLGRRRLPARPAQGGAQARLVGRPRRPGVRPVAFGCVPAVSP